jgi:hypothetical protein
VKGCLSFIIWGIHASCEVLLGLFIIPIVNYEKLVEAIKFFGFSDSVSIKKLKKRYRTISKELHPDKGGDEEKMKLVNEYYKCLMEYLESYEIPLDQKSMMLSSPEAFVYFQYMKKDKKDFRVGF